MLFGLLKIFNGLKIQKAIKFILNNTQAVFGSVTYMKNLQQCVIWQTTCLHVSASHGMTELRVSCSTAAEQRKATHYPLGLHPDSPESVTKG